MAESSRDEIAKLEALYANNPEGRVFTHLAEAYRKAGELDRARGILDDGLTRHEGYASAHVVLGRVLMDQRKNDEAAEAFRRVLALDPHNMVALRSLGDIARTGGRNAEALGYFEELRHIDPNSDDLGQIIEELAAPPKEAAPPAVAAAPAAPIEPEPPALAAMEVPEPLPTPEPEPAFGAGIELGWMSDAAEDVQPLPGDLADFADLSAVDSAGAGSSAEFADSLGDMPFDVTFGADQAETIDELFLDDPIAGDEFDEPVLAIPAAAADSTNEPALALPFTDEPFANESVTDDPPIEDSEETGEVVTETIAELYRSQQLYDRAADVYRALSLQRPGDPGLQARLAEVEHLARTGAAEAEPAGVETAPWIVGASSAADSPPSPYAWTEPGHDTPGQEAPPISAYFQNVLSWRPSGPVRKPDVAPAATEPFYQPPAEEEEPFMLLDEQVVASDDFYTMDESALDDPFAGQPAPPADEPWQAPPAPPPEAMPWDMPAEPEPAPPAAPAAPAVAASPPQPPPPPVAQAPRPPAAQPTVPAGDSTTPEGAFDEWFGPAEPSAHAPPAAEAAAPEEASGGEDDDDLEMFRSWLQSLKK